MSDHVAKVRTIGVFEAVMMLYLIASGGPFGVEEPVGIGGPMWTCFGLCVIALLWCIPQALVATELSLLMPSNGGSIQWVDSAFPGFLSHVNAWSSLASSVAAYSLLVELIAAYMPYGGPLFAWAIKAAAVVSCLVINIWGPQLIARLSIPCLVIVFLPFLMILAGMQQELFFSPSTVASFLYKPSEMRWSVFVPTLIWIFGSFDCIGNLAGEISGGKRTFFVALSLAFPLVLLNYIVPMSMCLSIQPVWWTSDTLWRSGGFRLIAASLSPTLAVWMDLAGALSNYIQYAASVAVVARQFEYCGLVGTLPSISSFSWLGGDGATVPVGGIVFSSLIMLAVTAVPFDALVQLFLFQRTLNLFFVYAAFAKLRFSNPSERFFAAPGPNALAWLYGVPTVALAILALHNADPLTWQINFGFEVIVLALFVAKWFFLWTEPDEPMKIPV